MNPLLIAWICDVETCIKFPFMFLGAIFTLGSFIALAIVQPAKMTDIARSMRIFAICSLIALVIGVLLPDPEILKCLLEQW